MRRRKKIRNVHAFTLVEILVAMALTAMVIVGMNTLLFSMGELWGRNTDRVLFELHTRNVTRFLQNELDTASLPPVGGAGGAQQTTTGSGGTAVSPVSIQEVRDQTGNSDNYITYELPNGSRLCAWPDRVIPNVVCSLAFREGQGLILLWHSRLETNYDIDAPRETLITPLISAISYDYYDLDAKAWKNETMIRKDNNNTGVLPQRLHLVFTYAGRNVETVIDIPGSPVQGMPVL